MKVFRVTAVGALVLLAVSAAFGMSVKSDYEKTYDFSQLHTFAFKTDRASNDPLNTNTIEAGRIQNALASQLEANGFTQATQAPDFIVAFYARTKQKPQSKVQVSVDSVTAGDSAGVTEFRVAGVGWGYGSGYLGYQLHSRLHHGRHYRPANQ